MQVLISLPGLEELAGDGGVEKPLLRKVCGVPLLSRVIATAARSGGTSVLILHPKVFPKAWLKDRLNFSLFSSIPIQFFALEKTFDPDNLSHWRAIENRLEARFLWLPWNFVVDKRLLSRLVVTGQNSDRGARFARSAKREEPCGRSPETAAVVITEKLTIPRPSNNGSWHGAVLRWYLADPSLDLIPFCPFPGCAVRSAETARQAEKELVRRSGKEWDGMHSKFNRRLCRPLVRWLSKTPITPNMVTLAGLPVAILSGYWFAQGHWSAYVLGALLYFVAVLFDEIDGMLARTTFRESAFGCWLESFVDYASYIPVFGGMAIGLYRQYGQPWLLLGALLLFGTVTTFLVATWHRKLASRIDKPSEYLNHYYRRLEADSGNTVSRFVRQVHLFIKKGVLCHYVLIFSVLGGIKVFFALAAFGSNAAWILGLYTSKVLRPSPVSRPTACKLPAASLPAR